MRIPHSTMDHWLFSGGKDSTVLQALVWKAIEKIKAETPVVISIAGVSNVFTDIRDYTIMKLSKTSLKDLACGIKKNDDEKESYHI